MILVPVIHTPNIWWLTLYIFYLGTSCAAQAHDETAETLNALDEAYKKLREGIEENRDAAFNSGIIQVFWISHFHFIH